MDSDTHKDYSETCSDINLKKSKIRSGHGHYLLIHQKETKRSPLNIIEFPQHQKLSQTQEDINHSH